MKYARSHVQLHCSAMAAAMPVKNRDRSFARSGPGDILQHRIHWRYAALPCSGGVSTYVGSSLGNPGVSQSPVFLNSECPNSHGCMYWSGSRHVDDNTPTGFSRATCNDFLHARFQSRAVHSTASIRLSFPGCSLPYHLFPDTHKYVHGGCMMIKSQSPVWYRHFIMSPCQ